MNNNKSKNLLKLTVLAMLVALGVIISPILRVEGMCPMAHFINITCSVLLGPWYSLVCALTIGIIRMAVMGIPPLALTGAIFGAFLSGVFYRFSKGNLLFAVLGEIIGTGIIGAIISYPVMSLIWGKDGISLFFYVPSFICGTLIGGSIAFAFLHKLAKTGALKRFQSLLGSRIFETHENLLGNTISIGALGVIGFVFVGVLASLLNATSPVWKYAEYSIIAVFVVVAVGYYVINKVKETKNVN